jgi:hypothetical protein
VTTFPPGDPRCTGRARRCVWVATCLVNQSLCRGGVSRATGSSRGRNEIGYGYKRTSGLPIGVRVVELFSTPSSHVNPLHNCQTASWREGQPETLVLDATCASAGPNAASQV